MTSRSSPPRAAFLVAAALAVAGAAGGAHEARADDGCATARDGACDELLTCALDSDSTDCRAICAAPWTSANAGACAHYRAVDAVTAAPPPDTGSHGSGGPVGLWDGLVNVRWTRPDTTIDRHYMVYVPVTYDPSRPTPLLFMLSGNTVDMYSLSWYTELFRTADINGFLLVFPQQPYVGGIYSWIIYANNWQGGDWKDNPEVAFVRTLIGEMKGLYNVDRTRIVASGHSRGSAMSVTLAFEMPDLIAGFISEMGFIKPQNYDLRMKAIWKGGRHFPAVLVHGRPDPDVAFGNSEYILKTMTDLGWTEGTDVVFHRFDNVAHEWQPQLSQEAWDFVADWPLPLELAAP